MISLVGKTARGKSAVQHYLLSQGYEKIPTWTTRPKRPGEQDDVDYHFTNDEDFQNKIEQGFFAEWKAYNTVHGIWYYGSGIEDIRNAKENSIIILTPAGLRDVKHLLPESAISILIDADDEITRERLLLRGDNPAEIERRFATDEEDFKDAEKLVDYVLLNTKDTSLADLANQIIEYHNKTSANPIPIYR